MYLGISSYTYTWAFGVKGNFPPKPMNAQDLIEKAFGHGLSRVQIADNYPLHLLSGDELSELAEFAKEHRIQIEVGARGLKPERLDNYLEIAVFFGSPFLRFVIDEEEYEPQIQEIISIIDKKLPTLRKTGILLAIENHDRFKCRELVHIMEQTDPNNVGICLDSVNSLGAGEGIKEVMDQLIPFTINFHIKDFSIKRLYHQMGFEVSGQPAGSGFMDIPLMVKNLKKHRRCLSGTLELWTPPEKNLRKTIQKENLWCEESLKYLKSIDMFQ